AWAIRTYIETRPDDDSLSDVTPELAFCGFACGTWSAQGSWAVAAPGERRRDRHTKPRIVRAADRA
ncbi:MAG: hypothetical protein AAFQ50_12030, partial [Pseudomonadota bacterium]